FGTYYSCISILNKEGRAEVIANEDGDRMIPSIVAFSGDEEFCGTPAKHQELRNAQNTVSEFRNALGQDLAEVQKIYAQTASKITEKDGVAAFEVNYKDAEAKFTAKEITSKFFVTLKQTAENYLGKTVDGVVMAVPSYFTEKQNEELKQAVEAAGLHILQLIHEPTAAALAYNLGQNASRKDADDKTVLVADLGGHNLDLTLLAARGGVYTVLGSGQDHELGGKNFDEALVNHFAAEFKRKNNIDISSNKRALNKLRAACEITKRTLSSAASAPCSVESLAEGLDFHSNINRMRFEMLCNKLFSQFLNAVEKVLEDNKLQASQIDEVLLVGGSTRIPKLQLKLRDVFPESTVVRTDVEADEAIAIGCALQALLISSLGDDESHYKSYLAPEVTNALHTTKAIGLVHEKEFYPIVSAATPLPLHRNVELPTSVDDQTEVYVALYEKESSQEAEPVLLAELVLSELPAAKAGETKVELLIQVDEAGKVQATLREKKSGKIAQAEIAAN
ncbi:HSP70-domain-containing protein, partial [Basidiobolus meristosporus CBS 931.73]